MKTVKIDKDVFVRDQYGVRRRVFIAGSEVDEAKYNATVKPEVEIPKVEAVIENKMLPEPEEVKEVEIEEAPVEKKEPVKEKKSAKVHAKAKK